jgi:hypothetical protein
MEGSCHTTLCFEMGWNFWNSPKEMIGAHWLPTFRTSITCWLWSHLKMSMFISWFSCMESNLGCKR